IPDEGALRRVELVHGLDPGRRGTRVAQRLPAREIAEPDHAREPVQTKASVPAAEIDWPTIVDPSSEMPLAWLLKLPPGRSPSPTMPVAAVQRNASVPLAPMLEPARTDPSPETALPLLW